MNIVLIYESKHLHCTFWNKNTAKIQQNTAKTEQNTAKPQKNHSKSLTLILISFLLLNSLPLVSGRVSVLSSLAVVLDGVVLLELVGLVLALVELVIIGL